MKTFKEFLSEQSKSLAGENGSVISHKGGEIDVQHKTKHAPRKQSVIHFNVPEESRNKGIGDTLVKMALEKHHDLGAQVSSHASLKIFHNNGFRNPALPSGTFEDHKKEFHENGGSLFVAHKDSDGNKYVK